MVHWATSQAADWGGPPAGTVHKMIANEQFSGLSAAWLGRRPTSAARPGRIYFDYQASTPIDAEVFDAMVPYFLTEFGNPHSADHAFGWKADDAISEARSKVASSVGAEPDEIVFTSGATEANNLAIFGIARARAVQRRRIVVSAIEHKSVLAVSMALAREGFEIAVIPVSPDGIVQVEVAAQLIDERTSIVSVMAVNNEIGTIQPIREIAAMARSVGAIFHSDAAQALASIPLNVGDLGIDLMSLTAHKCYGPKGVGALYVRRDLKDRPTPIILGGGQEGGLRSGTLPTPLCVGFGIASAIIRARGDGEVRQVRTLRDKFLTELQNVLDGVHVNGALESRHPGNLNVRFEGVEATLLLQSLQPAIAASTGSACTSGIPEPSHVLRAIGLSAEEAETSIRFSIGRFTTDFEIAHVVELIVTRVRELRG